MHSQLHAILINYWENRGRELPVHPLDLSTMLNITLNPNPAISIDVTACGSTFDGADDTASGFGVDMILGDAFLRNVYVSYVTFYTLRTICS